MLPLLFIGSAIAASIAYAMREDIAGAVGELKTPTPDTGDAAELANFKKRQAIREYNALLERTDPEAPPTGTICAPCLAKAKARRRKRRQDLMRNAQVRLATEDDPAVRDRIMAATHRLGGDMDRVEDARLALHTYTYNEDATTQPDFLSGVRDEPPPGYKRANLDEMADDFGVNRVKVKDLVASADNPSQKIMVYQRDEEVLGPGPKYTVAFRGSTTDRRDWNNNGRNELGYEAPHQAKAADLGKYLARGAKKSGKPIDSLVSSTGHSKGGSEAQAFAAASGAQGRVFNPAGFNPSAYAATKDVDPAQMRVERVTIMEKDHDGNAVEAHTDPLYYAQHEGLGRFVMKKSVTSGVPREVSWIDPNLSVPSKKQSDTEAHSMLQVVEALERDKSTDEQLIEGYVNPTPAIRRLT